MLFLIVTVLILFGYQNCYKPQLNTLAEKNTESVSVQEIPLSGENIKEIVFYNKEAETVQKSGNSISLVTSYSYSVDLVSGKILKFSSEDTKKNEYCLTPALLEEIRNLLLSSKVCKTTTQISKDLLCAQMLTPPYARISTSREDFDLGFMADSCGSQKVDLCQEAPSMAKGWWTYVYTNLSQLSCSEN